MKNKGNQVLIANMLKKAQNGKNITVVGLGGSITQGAGSRDTTNNTYGKLVADWLQQTFTDNNYNSTVTYKNAGIGATTSDLGLAQWTKLWNDYIHPNDAGHKLSANAINYYIKTVLENIDSISTVLPEVPQKLFYANTAAYIGSTKKQLHRLPSHSIPKSQFTDTFKTFANMGNS